MRNLRNAFSIVRILSKLFLLLHCRRLQKFILRPPLRISRYSSWQASPTEIRPSFVRKSRILLKRSMNVHKVLCNSFHIYLRGGGDIGKKEQNFGQTWLLWECQNRIHNSRSFDRRRWSLTTEYFEKSSLVTENGKNPWTSCLFMVRLAIFLELSAERPWH